MAVYHYSAVNRAGEVRTGRIEAASQALAVESLARDSLMPLQLREANAGIDLRTLLPWGGASVRGASRDDVVLMTQQLASLTRAGLTLDRALGIALQLAESPPQRRLLEDLMTRVRRGSSFTEALDAHRASFPAYYISMVQAGEAGGALPNILERLSGLLVRSQETRQKVVSALIYPAILLSMIGFTLILILSFVLPRFQSLFAEAGSKLPLPTRVVMALGDAVQNYGVVLAAILVVAGLLVRRAWRSPDTRARLDGWMLRRRWLGAVIRKAESARFARTLGTLVGGGMPVPTSLRIASGSLYNRVLQQASAKPCPSVTPRGRVSPSSWAGRGSSRPC